MFYALLKRHEAAHDMQNWRAGLITSAIYNVNRDLKKQRKPYTPEDFIPRRADNQPKPMTVEASVDYVANLNRLLGGVDLRPKAIA